MTRRDRQTVDLFEAPRPAAPVPGSMDFRACVAELLGGMLDHARRSAWIAGIRGGRLFLGEDALAAELGNVRRARDELQERERAIRDHLRRAR